MSVRGVEASLALVSGLTLLLIGLRCPTRTPLWQALIAAVVIALFERCHQRPVRRRASRGGGTGIFAEIAHVLLTMGIFTRRP